MCAWDRSITVEGALGMVSSFLFLLTGVAFGDG
jgi:hypothetical protein